MLFWIAIVLVIVHSETNLHNIAMDHRKGIDKKNNLRWPESLLCLCYSVFIYSSFNYQVPTLCLVQQVTGNKDI